MSKLINFITIQQRGKDLKEIKEIKSIEELEDYIFLGTQICPHITGNPDFMFFTEDFNIFVYLLKNVMLI